MTINTALKILKLSKNHMTEPMEIMQSYLYLVKRNQGGQKKRFILLTEAKNRLLIHLISDRIKNGEKNTLISFKVDEESCQYCETKGFHIQQLIKEKKKPCTSCHSTGLHSKPCDKCVGGQGYIHIVSVENGKTMTRNINCKTCNPVHKKEGVIYVPGVYFYRKNNTRKENSNCKKCYGTKMRRFQFPIQKIGHVQVCTKCEGAGIRFKTSPYFKQSFGSMFKIITSQSKNVIPSVLIQKM